MSSNFYSAKWLKPLYLSCRLVQLNGEISIGHSEHIKAVYSRLVLVESVSSNLSFEKTRLLNG